MESASSPALRSRTSTGSASSTTTATARPSDPPASFSPSNILSSDRHSLATTSREVPDTSANALAAVSATASNSTYTRHNAPRRSNVKPRWHTQPYMMFLALRSMPNREAARQELINAAVELDKKFSKEKGLPRVFTGKTPMNSASACLTNNGDKYFIPFKPEGSKSTHFRLAYQPGDFDTAVKEYDHWMEKLVKHDWPLCFGTPKDGAVPIHILEKQAREKQEREQVEVDAATSRTRTETTELRSESVLEVVTSVEIEAKVTVQSSVATFAGYNGSEAENETLTRSATEVTEATLGSLSNQDDSKKRSPEPMDTLSPDLELRIIKKVKADSDRSTFIEESSHVTETLQHLEIKASESATSSRSSTPAPTSTSRPSPLPQSKSSTPRNRTTSSSSSTTGNPKQEVPVPDSQRVDEYRLEDLDLTNVPNGLSEAVRVDASTIPNSGNGLFAKVDLPASTPLGFYFGVPMTENEFDSLKDGVGLASHYSIMYRRTVLDATDENGMPYSDPNGRLYCPFHFMNEHPSGNISFITGSVVNQVICTTNRDVKAGEELFVFYGKEVDRFWENHDGSGSEGGDIRKSQGSRGASPARRQEPLTDRPRRTNVHKPARYTR